MRQAASTKRALSWHDGGLDGKDEPMTTGPLARFKVIDLTRVRAGPTCVRQFADWGADVIKIESPEGDAGLGGERHGPDFQNLHRNKRSLTLNLKSPEGVEVMKRLVKQADVVVENYRPDVKFRLGVDYESLKAINPAHRLCEHLRLWAGRSVSRPAGLRPDRAGHGRPDVHHGRAWPRADARRHSGRRPYRRHLRRHGHPYCAAGTGAVRRRPMGQKLPCSALRFPCWISRRRAGRSPRRCRARPATTIRPRSLPGCSPQSDGYINIAAAGDDIYRRLCKALNAEHLATDPLFATGRARSENRDALNEAIEAITRGKTSAEWIDLLNKQGVPGGPIYNMDQVFADPQVKHLGMTRVVPHPVIGDVEVVGQPIELSRTPWSIRSATPEPGEHTDAILSELGYGADEITKLHIGKVV